MKKEKCLSGELKKLSLSDIYSFHMPGHKRNMKSSVLSAAYDMDITEIDGFDDLSRPEGLIRQLEERAAKYYGTDRAFLLVNGSTCGILAAISASVPHGGKLIMARNSHKSAFNAAYLGELETFYIKPRLYEKFGLCGDTDTDSLKETLESIPKADAVFITSPTYEGFVSDVETAAEMAHAHNLPIIVDAAHGAHLDVSKKADICIVSLHKTYPALTSSALCLLNGNIIDAERLKFFINIFQTSSPSYILMAGIGECFDLLENEGEKRKAALKEELKDIYELCSDTKAVKLITGKEIKEERGFDFDESKLNFYDSSKTLNGREIYDILLGKHHIQPEMALGRYCLCLSSIMDTEEGFSRLRKAVKDIDDDIRSGKFGKKADRY